MYHTTRGNFEGENYNVKIWKVIPNGAMPSYVTHPRELPTHFRYFELTWLRRVKFHKTRIHFDLWFFIKEIHTCQCQRILPIVFCHWEICHACVLDDVVFFSSILPFSEPGPNFSQFEPIFPKEEEPIVLVICSSILLPPFSFFLPYYVQPQLDLSQNKLIGVSQCSSSTYKWSQDLFIVTRTSNL